MLAPRREAGRISTPHSAFRIPHSNGSRRGITLVEVLIAMFVMALGLMGVLALFPIGALQMANAVKDERTLQTAQIVEGNARVLWRQAYPNSTTTETAGFQNEPGLQAFVNPDPGANAGGGGALGANELAYNVASPLPALINSTSADPSFPIYIDAIGRQTQQGNAGPWVGGLSSAATVGAQQYQVGIPRRTIRAITLLPASGPPPTQTTARIRLFGLLDDMSYSNQGLASPVNRGGRYNAACLIQRAATRDYNRANLTVVVYQNRPPADVDSSETPVALNQQMFPGSTTIAFPRAGIPALKKGAWVLITGVIDVGAANPNQRFYAYANFYRIISIQDVGANYQLEVNPPLKDCRPPALYWNQAYYPGNIIAMDNVAEVFERPVLKPGN